MYTNRLALEAALMELALYVEHLGPPEVGDNVRGALQTTPATSNWTWLSSRARVSAKSPLNHFRIAAGKPKIGSLKCADRQQSDSCWMIRMFGR